MAANVTPSRGKYYMSGMLLSLITGLIFVHIFMNLLTPGSFGPFSCRAWYNAGVYSWVGLIFGIISIFLLIFACMPWRKNMQQ